MANYINELRDNSLKGFDFSNYKRNLHLLDKSRGAHTPYESFPNTCYTSVEMDKQIANSNPEALKNFIKKGTTICGVVVSDEAVIVASDSRATMGPIVSDKNCKKVTKLSDFVATGGAGVAADLYYMNKWLITKIQLHEYNTKTRIRISSLITILSQELFKYQGHVGCAIIMGGFDVTGPSLYSCSPEGSSRREAFVSMGSGSLNAYSILETGYRSDLTLNEGIDLATRAITAGILNDLASGSHVHLCVITKDGANHYNEVYTPSLKLFRQPEGYLFKQGSTKILKETIKLKKTNNIEQNVIMAEN